MHRSAPSSPLTTDPMGLGRARSGLPPGGGHATRAAQRRRERPGTACHTRGQERPGTACRGQCGRCEQAPRGLRGKRGRVQHKHRTTKWSSAAYTVRSLKIICYQKG